MKLQAPQPDLLRKLPSVDELLKHPEVAALIGREGHTSVAEAARQALARIRQEVSDGRLDERGISLARDGMPAAIERELRQALAPSLRRSWAARARPHAPFASLQLRCARRA